MLKKSNKKLVDRKLTEHMITKFTNIYAANLKIAAPDVDNMRSDALDGILHTQNNTTFRKLKQEVDMCWNST